VDSVELISNWDFIFHSELMLSMFHASVSSLSLHFRYEFSRVKRDCDAILHSKINVCLCMFHASVSSSLFYTSDIYEFS
jgi:hypothetical protein